MKERIIGAVVLVIFVVLVVPIFLDGPPQEGEVVSERVLLPGQVGQETKTVVLDRERSVPVPTASPTATTSAVEEQPTPRPLLAAAMPEETPADEPEPQPEVLVEEKPEVPEQPAATAPAPSVTSTTGMWAVQLGSFSNKENAERLADQLRRQGYAAFVSQVATANGTMHRVRIGPQKDRQSADAMAARLAKAGHQGRPVPHP